MAASKVYFTDMHAKNGDNLLQKLERLMKKAGFEEIDFEGKFVAIKLHFGEPGNLAFLRPNYAKVVCDYVTRLGGKP
ncbi:MAG: 4Fe-4S ferredoxin, partial [Oscillospiraceae bacterium]|nr:4Fe-4S ferredoxin [Oscillospiraceae bacterium]